MMFYYWRDINSGTVVLTTEQKPPKIGSFPTYSPSFETYNRLCTWELLGVDFKEITPVESLSIGTIGPTGIN